MTARQFNTEWLRARRTQAGHSTHSLAAHLGVSPATVRAVEGGADPDRYTYGLLRSYADGLGCTVEDLFAPVDEHTSPHDDGQLFDETGPSDDIARIVALLVDVGGTAHCDTLAAALGWSPEEARSTLRLASAALTPVGLTVAWQGDMAVTLVPAPGINTPVDTVAATSVEVFGLTKAATRLLASVAQAGVLSRATDAGAGALLQQAGLIEPVPPKVKHSRPTHGVRSAVRLTRQARFNLCLET